MPKVKMAVAYERRARVLAALRDRGAEARAVELSMRSLAEAAGLTYDQARSAVRALVREGAVRPLPRLLPNGGTSENAYLVEPAAPEAEGARARVPAAPAAAARETERAR